MTLNATTSNAPISNAATSNVAVLNVQGLTLRFGGLRVLGDVSFSVAEGELVALIGPNGAGKSSLFNCLNGVYRPQEGSINFRGQEIVGRNPATIAHMGLARTFQNLALFERLDVIDNLMLGRHHLMRTGFITGSLWLGRARREERSHRAHCEEIADFLDLTQHGDRPVGDLPYGVRKRIELGRALAMDPQLLLLDEPVAGMNQAETEDMARSIYEIRSEIGVAIIMVEHDLALVMDLSDRVMVLDFGERIALGTPAQVQADPAVIAAYLGGAPE